METYDIIINQVDFATLGYPSYVTSTQLGLASNEVAKIHTNLTEFTIEPDGGTISSPTGFLTVYDEDQNAKYFAINNALDGVNDRLLFIGTDITTAAQVFPGKGLCYYNDGNISGGGTNAYLKITLFYEKVVL